MTEKMKQLVQEKGLRRASALLLSQYPPTTKNESAYIEVLLAFAERQDLLEKQLREVTKAVRHLAMVMNDMANSESAEGAEEGTEAAEEPDEQSRDKTPFPSGLKTSAGGAGTTGPLPDEDEPATPPAAAAPPPKRAKNGAAAQAKEGA